ncbi:MAG: C69 family dipeptidase [Promethearchaeota archaeon]
MCDTIVATPEVTKNQHMLFGKNSDRESDECQNLVYNPAANYASGDTVECTYLTIPQSSKTFSSILSKPFWMFGAEMGVNEHGVMIGNEAVFTRIKPETTGLTGMDLIRLALERSQTAREAKDTIIQLLETHGQGGNCGYRHKLTYMNGFILADAKEAFVLETVVKEWAWKQIQGVWSISNRISLEKDYEARSENLIEMAIQKGWCKSEIDFNFSKCYSDKIITWGARAYGRQCDNRNQLEAKKGSLTLQDFMAFLRTHTTSSSNWYPTDGLRMTVCAHATNILTRGSNSVSSMVAEGIPNNPAIFTTGASNPCISPYFPIAVAPTGLPTSYQPGGEEYSENNFWWKAERLHRDVMIKFDKLHDPLSQEVRKLEQSLYGDGIFVKNSKIEYSKDDINRYFREIEAFIDHWSEKAAKSPKDSKHWKFRQYWNKYNRKNKVSM